MSTPISLFDSLVEQWGGPTSFQSALGTTELHGTLPPDVAGSLIDWDRIAELLRVHRLAPPHIKVVRSEGRAINPKNYMDTDSTPRRVGDPMVDTHKLGAILDVGATLVIESVDELLPSLGATAMQLSGMVGEWVQTHLYATRGDVPAFAPHWDILDVLIVQVEGEKHWDVYGPGNIHPIDATVDPDNTRPDEAIWSGVLRPGDVLYLPRGWYHGVRGTGASSLHLSYGFQRRTGLAYLRWLTAFARRAEPFREDLPTSGSREDLDRHEKVLLECLAQLVHEHPVHEFLAEHGRTLVPPAPRALGHA